MDDRTGPERQEEPGRQGEPEQQVEPEQQAEAGREEVPGWSAGQEGRAGQEDVTHRAEGVADPAEDPPQPTGRPYGGERHPTPEEISALGDEISQLAGQIAAAEARFLRLLGEFDVLGGWGGPGIRSLAHWLSWRCGMSLRTAREHVRVARALRRLPVIAKAFGKGELSFSKVRALTRVARPETEDSLVRLAKNAPAAHVERVVAGLRKVMPGEEKPGEEKPGEEKPGEEKPGEGEAGEDPSGGAGESGGDDGGGDDGDGGGAEGGEPASGEGVADGDGGAVPEPGAGPSAPEAAHQARTKRSQAAPAQRLQWRWDQESDELVVWGRFGASDGKLILAALTRAELERIRTVEQEKQAEAEAESQTRSGSGEEAGAQEPSGSGEVGGPDDAEERAGRRSDGVDRTAPPPSDAGPALVALAQIGLAVQDAPEHAAAAEVVYLHQSAHGGYASGHGVQHRSQAEPPGAHGGSSSRTGEGRRPDSPGIGVVGVDDGPALDQAAAEEVLCGSASRCVLTGAKGAVLRYGRRRRKFSAAQLKALRLRDRCCQTPGCGRTRFLHAHHVVYWWHGGTTDLDNAVLLCSACHRSVHLGRLRIRALGGQQFEFIEGVTGGVMDPAPPLSGQADVIMAQRTIGPRTVTGGWFGEPLDLSLVTAELLQMWRMQKTTDQRYSPATPADSWGPTITDSVDWDDPSLGPWQQVSAA